MEGAESRTPALLEVKVSGSADRAAQFPVAAGTIMLGGWSHGHCSPPATVFSGAMGSGATAGGPGLQDHLHCLAGVPHLCVSAHPSLHI